MRREIRFLSLLLLFVVGASSGIVYASQPNVPQDTTIADQVTVNAQTPEFEQSFDFTNAFCTFGTLVAAITVLVQFFKKLTGKIPSLLIQILSWLVGIVVTLLGWYLEMGFLNGLPWYIAVIYGIGASLSANGVYVAFVNTKAVCTGSNRPSDYQTNK